jgi:tetratricopeptide (TPR) repeat protein
MLIQAEILSGEFADVAPLAERAQELSARVGDFRGQVWARTYGYAERAAHAGDFAGALEHYNVVIHLYKEVRARRHELSFNLGRAAEMLLRLGRYREAFDYSQEGLAIALETSNKLEYGYAYMVLAEFHASEAYRDWEKASWYLEESLKAFREVGAQVDIGRAYLAGARIARLRNDGNARQWAKTARAIFAERGAKVLRQEAEELLTALE